MPRLDRGIQYTAASPHHTGVSGILGRPVPAPPRLRRGHKGARPPKLQRRRQAGRRQEESATALNAPPRPSAWSRLASVRAWRSTAARCPSRRRASRH
ncbi:hypothetical protein EAS61_10480 [Bradyrhizobium zhanjiangense]|uniref:Uncharacterized protein n=1 Tax=Bradyrhizobium zhanjiangense TaxID=1325107 RepID=A0A4Q0QRA5_9BRAD|nr:hypothetical protein EAS61_10480 [Bradyrhizobium zhanjiangense]